MKVLDNLDNYEIPKGYHLTAEQEDVLGHIVEEVVYALIPIRSSKRETRKYFSQHLRYSSNLYEQMQEPDYPRDEYEFGQHYKPLEGEYIWDSNLLHPVLISVLERDRQSFGYILNLLNEDMANRKGEANWFWRKVSDDAVKYCLKFDIEEIRAKVEGLSSYEEKLDYLNKVQRDVDLFGGLEQDDYDEFGRAFEYYLGKLTDSIKEEQEIWGDSKAVAKEVPAPEPQSSEPVEISLTPHQFKGEKLSSDGTVLSDVYYSPEVLGTGQFSDLDFELKWGEPARQQKHIGEFEGILQSYFKNCYVEDNGISLNSKVLNESSQLIDTLFEDYSDRINTLYKENYDVIRRKITIWLKVTIQNISKIYNRNKKFVPKENIDSNTGYPMASDYYTTILLDVLVDQTYDSFLKRGYLYFGWVDESLTHVMPYNLWGGGYDKDYADCFGKVALSDENRAKVFQKANKEWLIKKVKDICDSYELDCDIDLPFDGPDSTKCEPKKQMPRLFQNLFADYVRRVNNNTEDKNKAHDAFQIWVFDLMYLLNDMYQEEIRNLNESEYDNPTFERACRYFYTGCSLPTLMDMLLNYYSDYEEVAKLDSKTQKGTEPIEEKTIIENAVIPQPVEPNEKEEPPHKDVLGDAFCYKYDNDMLFNQLLQLMLRATEDSATTLSKELINETFDVISGEFDHFLQTTDIFTEDRINVLFMCFDHWFDTFKRLADAVFSTCQQTIRPKSRKKSDAEAARVKEKKAQSMAMFIIEKAIVTVSGIKANILYNHQYFEQVFYNINGWKVETILAEMDRLENAFGVGRERDILFRKYANIEAFYEKLVNIVRGGLLEVHGTADTMSEEERLETFRSHLKAEVDFDLPMYIELVKMERDFSTETYHSAVSWVETTKYCLYQVLIEAERRIAEDENLSVEIDYAYFQKSNLAFIPNMFAEALVEYESITGNYEIDEKLNHLGERDEDDWDSEVPIFDPSLLGEDFITEEDLGLPPEDEPTPELNGEIAQDISGDAPLIAIVKETDLPEKKTEREVLLSHILLTDQQEEVVSYIKAQLAGKKPTDAVALLVAARELAITDSIPQADAEKLFGTIAGRSTYDAYYGGGRKVKEASKQVYIKALKQKFQIP